MDQLLSIRNKKMVHCCFFDAEGCVSLSNKKYVNLEFYQANRLVLQDLKKFLSQLNIRTTKIVKRKGRKLFCLRITNEDGIQLFKKKIPLLHPKKIKKLFSYTKAP